MVCNTSELFLLWKWLLKNPDLIPFFQIDSPDDSINEIQECKAHLEISINTLIEIKETISNHLMPIEPIFPHNFKHMPSASTFLAHTHFFVQHELYQCKHLMILKSISICHDIIKILQSTIDNFDILNFNQIITINKFKLLHFLIQDSDDLIRFMEYDSYLVNIISNQDLILLKSDDIQSLKLKQIVFSMKPMLDRHIIYLPINPLQETFEQFFFHPNFLFRKEVLTLINDFDPKHFMELSFSLMQDIIKTFKISDTMDIAIVSLIYYRSLFDEVYQKYPEVYNVYSYSKINKYRDKITIKMTGASTKFLPKNSFKNLQSISPNDSMNKIVHNNGKFLNNNETASLNNHVGVSANSYNMKDIKNCSDVNFASMNDNEESNEFESADGNNYDYDHDYDNVSVLEIVNGNQYLTKAKNELTDILFLNSPLDILHGIHLSLVQIRMYVHTFEKNEDPNGFAQSFDTIFGLFLLAVIACEIPIPENIFEFLINFAPNNRLSGPLLYARATIVAAKVHLTQIVKNFEESE
ncbi:hypothetical protein TRFO_35468 [Tritrichomonas foetus]|uniref:VPS9 domain-containing protein n=1 Tax=Tritrichomonas foetus TaxID=1144522 RepID=A0A1J4JKQ3_9EUKA|nr:hypothetical protein TRFO_35468 [Tritrichomonas foetus]|eukprot:OHS98141.1 hypothetical protein TRFO_35468 [Tritrichomonas foetus]